MEVQSTTFTSLVWLLYHWATKHSHLSPEMFSFQINLTTTLYIQVFIGLMSRSCSWAFLTSGDKLISSGAIKVVAVARIVHSIFLCCYRFVWIDCRLLYTPICHSAYTAGIGKDESICVVRFNPCQWWISKSYSCIPLQSLDPPRNLIFWIPEIE